MSCMHRSFSQFFCGYSIQRLHLNGTQKIVQQCTVSKDTCCASTRRQKSRCQRHSEMSETTQCNTVLSLVQCQEATTSLSSSQANKRNKKKGSQKQYRLYSIQFNSIKFFYNRNENENEKQKVWVVIMMMQSMKQN